jgi:hypothetical protein
MLKMSKINIPYESLSVLSETRRCLPQMHCLEMFQMQGPHICTVMVDFRATGPGLKNNHQLTDNRGALQDVVLARISFPIYTNHLSTRNAITVFAIDAYLNGTYDI